MIGSGTDPEVHPEPLLTVLDASSSQEVRLARFAPRQVKVCLTPVTTGTLVTVVTQEWQGALKTDTRVMALRLDDVGRLEWSLAPHDALTRVIVALAAYLEA